MAPKATLTRPAPPAPQNQFQPLQPSPVQQSQSFYQNVPSTNGSALNTQNIANTLNQASQMASAANTLRKQVTPQQMQAMNNVLNAAQSSGLPNPLMPQ